MDMKKELQLRHTSINQCSKTTGIPYGSLYPIVMEQVNLDNCTYGTLKRLAMYFGCSIEELYPDTDRLEVYWRNEKVSDVRIYDNYVTVTRYNLHPAKQLFYTDKMTRMEFGEILRQRCWDEHRMNLKLYLKNLGLDSFNPYEICKKTHGVMFQDSIWFKYPGEQLTWEDVRCK